MYCISGACCAKLPARNILLKPLQDRINYANEEAGRHDCYLCVLSREAIRPPIHTCQLKQVGVCYCVRNILSIIFVLLGGHFVIHFSLLSKRLSHIQGFELCTYIYINIVWLLFWVFWYRVCALHDRSTTEGHTIHNILLRRISDNLVSFTKRMRRKWYRKSHKTTALPT